MENLHEQTNENSNKTSGNQDATEIWKAAGFTEEQIAVMRNEAAAKVEAQKKEKEQKVREQEFESNLEIILNDPLLANHKEDFSKFARESSLRNFGKEGLMETMKLFNKQLESNKSQNSTTNSAPQQGIDNPGHSTRSGANSQSLPGLDSNPALVDYTKVDLEQAHPSVRREVERRQKILENRRQTRAYGW